MRYGTTFLFSIINYILICSEFQVNSRLYAKRSLIGSRAVQVVEEFFKAERFAKDPSRIAQYAQWALRHNGPALWRVPTPQDCNYDPKSDHYIVRYIHLAILLIDDAKTVLYRSPLTFSNPSSSSKPFRLSSKGARIPVETMDVFRVL
jgi:hypothetical protein